MRRIATVALIFALLCSLAPVTSSISVRAQGSDPYTRIGLAHAADVRALVNYSGHGNVDVWAGAPIFNNSDAMALTNGNKLPLVVVMDCLNGYFAAPNLGDPTMKIR